LNVFILLELLDVASNMWNVVYMSGFSVCVCLSVCQSVCVCLPVCLADDYIFDAYPFLYD